MLSNRSPGVSSECGRRSGGLFGFFVLSHRHVQTDSASRGLYTLFGCQVHNGIVSIQESLCKRRSEMRRGASRT